MREGATEFHMVGGLHPDLPFEYFLDLMRGLKKRCPTVHLKAFTMVEVGYFSRISKLSIRDSAGGAERSRRGFAARRRRGNFQSARAQDHLRPQSQRSAVAQYRAHGARGRPALQRHDALRPRREPKKSASSTCWRCASLQDETHGFVAFIPLAFHPENTALAHLPKPTGFHDLKTIAVSRLLLDNFDHIKAYWIMLTPRIAQIALRFGADDLDGTVVEEKIYHDAGATTAQFTSRAELERLIRAGGPRARRARHALSPGGPLEDAAAPASPERHAFDYCVAPFSIVV